MLTHRRTPRRTLGAMLLVLALLLMLAVVPCVDAAETIALSSDVTLASQTLDGTVLDATAAATAPTTVNALLQRCTVKGSGFTVSAAATIGTAGSNPITIRILDTDVRDATMTFRNYLPSGSDVRIVSVTATMEGSTPLFDLQNFYLKAGTGSSMTIQRVRATWGTGDGGSVVQVGGSDDFSTLTGKAFSVSDAVVTGAAHVLEITANCTANYCFDTSGGLNAVDLIEFRDARGAFLYSNPNGTTVSSSNKGMIRFSNITMTGGQTFLSIEQGTNSGVVGTSSGNIVFSAISSDGPLFSLTPGQRVCAADNYVKYTFRHLNVAAVMSASTSYTANMPYGCGADSDPTWYFYMGNITVAGTLLDTIDELESNHLYATQLVGAYGEVIEVRQGDNWPAAQAGDAAAVNCVTGRDGNVAFVELVPDVQRAECNCDPAYNAPYCTNAVDPLVYYDAYSPSPATCAVANCDTCLFGQTSQCGACSTGYQLTASLGCDRIPCSTPNCSDCTTDDVCNACDVGYVLSADDSRCIACSVPHCAHCTLDDVCVSCGDSYSLSADMTACYACSIPNCNGCSADGVCDSCSPDHTLSPDKRVCFSCNIPNCNACSADDVCDSCADDYSLSDLESACFSCHVSNCSRCTADDVCGSCEKGYTPNDKGVCKKNGVGWWVWLIVGIAAAAVVAGVVVLVACCVRRGHRRETAEASEEMHAKSATSRGHDDPDSTQVMQGQSCVDTVESRSTAGPTTAAYRWTLDARDYAVMPTGQGSHVYIANPLNIDSR